MSTPVPDQLMVLVVDDDELNRRMMRLLLSRDNHHVHVAASGMEALAEMESYDFDLILMDLQMPEMGGVETSRKIRGMEKDGKHPYIVALTASYLPEKGRELFEAGIDNYIAKPFDLEHLRQMLHHGLDHRKSNKPSAVVSQARPQTAEVRSFDPSVGIKLVGGDEATFRELFAGFVEVFPVKLKNIEDCFAERNMDGLSIAAHNLKGVSANLGVLQLSEYAGRLEKQAGEGYTTSLETIIVELRDISRKFLSDASNFLSKKGNEQSAV